MSTDTYEDIESDFEETFDDAEIVTEASPSTKLARRRKIEDLFEQKRLEEELRDFA